MGNAENGSATSRNSARARRPHPEERAWTKPAQIRVRVRASRRMRTWPTCFETPRCARLLSMRARQAQARTNLWLWEMIAGPDPLFRDCYLQWMAQLRRVEPSARGPVVRSARPRAFRSRRLRALELAEGARRIAKRTTVRSRANFSDDRCDDDGGSEPIEFSANARRCRLDQAGQKSAAGRTLTVHVDVTRNRIDT
jgi:hypothetical protein